MKRILNVLLLILMFALFVGCSNSEPNSLSLDFNVEGLSLDNEEVDGRSDYYSKINGIIRNINNHASYPSHTFLDNIDDLTGYYDDGVSRDDYHLEDEKTLRYSYHSNLIQNMIQSIPLIVQGVGPAFYEESEISYYGSNFTTYANDDYVYYHSENDQDESTTFEVLVEDDNIKMTYLYESDTQILFQKNDFNQGYLDVRLRQDSNDHFSYSYEFYNYQTDQYEKIEYVSHKNTFKVTLGDYLNGEFLEYRKDVNSEIYNAILFTNGHKDIDVTKSVYEDDTISYNIYYNITNISEWDYYKENKLYLDDSEVLSDYSLSMQNGFFSTQIHQELNELTQENYNIIGDSVYNGPITFEDIQSSLENAESISDTYSITYTDSDEVNTVVIDSNTYSLDELEGFFEALINDEEQDTTS